MHDPQIQGINDEECYQRCRPIGHEHDQDTEDGTHEADPMVVVLEGRSEAERLSKGSMEAGEVDETVCSQEEVGDDGSDQVQITDHTAAYGQDKSEHIAATWFVIFSVAHSKVLNVRKKPVLAKSLEDFWSGHQTGQR